jgi:MFS transporter, OFA family, oxalate/formate antiporter
MLTPAVEGNLQRVSRWRYAAVIAASILIMLCSGAVYAWSIFVAPLQAEFGFSNTQTQIVYGLIIALFTVGMLFVNKSYAATVPE